MALNKQPLEINFAQGLETKTDPFQVPIGKFLDLKNSVFDTQGRLTKRNGFAQLTPLPNVNGNLATTFSGNLTVLGDSLQSYSSGTAKWVDKGAINTASLSTIPLFRSSNNQTQADSVVAANGLACTVFTDNQAGTIVYSYVITDSSNSQNIIAESTITPTSGTVNHAPRVFLLVNKFVILFTTSTSHLQYISIPVISPSTPSTAADIATAVTTGASLAWDGLVANNNLYIAYNTTGGGQSVKITYLPANLPIIPAPVVYAGEIATMFSLTADMTLPSSPIIYVSYYDSVSQVGKTLAVDQILNPVLAPTSMISATSVANLASTALNDICTLFYEVNNNYGGAIGAVATNYISKRSITEAGSVGSASTVVRSVGLASKAFLLQSVAYFMATFQSSFQPTRFLIDEDGNVISRIAYSNAGPYLTTGLPNTTTWTEYTISGITGTYLNGSTNTVAGNMITVNGSNITVNGVTSSLSGASSISVNGILIKISKNSVQIPYLIKDLIAAINKGTNLSSSTPVNPVYSQTGINLVSLDLKSSNVTASEIGSNLNISGGMLWAYDGVKPVEQGFNLWPEQGVVSTSGSGGSITAQQYYYQFVYEWADNQGNVFRSAPSLPVTITTTGSTSTNTLTIPTLRLTYKTKVRITAYRWSVAQQTYYAITPPSAAGVFSDPTVDYITITDTASDASILGNPILYTTGGVVENIPGPASNLINLFDNRLWMVDAEDPNLLWYSKQVIESTPVEMSDLLTLYVAPATASQGSTGPITALAPLDDKLIIFKASALGYINGIGPDNTGANNQYSNFTLINSVAGCTNQHSIVLTPSGLMFQSSKGIWILNRNLTTEYIGAPVEAFTKNATVLSAINVPTTNQVRFTMSSGITLMYDYFYGQWGTFTNIPATSSTIVDSLHTYINSYGQVFQETPGLYLDGAVPVLMGFKSSWYHLAGLQGFERFYQALLLGTYVTPFKLNVQMAYDYSPSVTQATLVSPLAPSANYGGDTLWGGNGPWGGPSYVFESRIFPQIQKCESFQITIDEVYDPSYGIAAGAGLTLSGMNLLVGMKKGYRTSSSSRSFG